MNCAGEKNHPGRIVGEVIERDDVLAEITIQLTDVLAYSAEIADGAMAGALPQIEA